MQKNLHPVWKELINIYGEISQICERHHLRYFVSAGTLLGAVRHHGFIPWDDDFDLHMPRPDYVRFCEIAQEELPAHLKIIDYNNTREYMFRFLKVQETDRETYRRVEAESGYMNPHGLYIDIFPLDGRPNSLWGNFWLRLRLFCAYARTTYLFRKGAHAGLRGYVGEYIGVLMGPFFRGIRVPKDWVRMYDRWSQKYVYDECEFVGRFSDDSSMIGWRTSRDNYQDSVVMSFNDAMVKCPIGYAKLLESWYGDYMRLPPEGQRVSNHVACLPAPWKFGPTGL